MERKQYVGGKPNVTFLLFLCSFVRFGAGIGFLVFVIRIRSIKYVMIWGAEKCCERCPARKARKLRYLKIATRFLLKKFVAP